MRNWLLRSWHKINAWMHRQIAVSQQQYTGQICMGSIGRMGGPANN